MVNQYSLLPRGFSIIGYNGSRRSLGKARCRIGKPDLAGWCVGDVRKEMMDMSILAMTGEVGDQGRSCIKVRCIPPHGCSLSSQANPNLYDSSYSIWALQTSKWLRRSLLVSTNLAAHEAGTAENPKRNLRETFIILGGRPYEATRTNPIESRHMRIGEFQQITRLYNKEDRKSTRLNSSHWE